ncbi:hypothetical protein KAR91_59405 [Candidatus Pacearchaeota archaeon]|nr:hypothetical protein [Candidatus Pacearchaeota archaeon]
MLKMHSSHIVFDQRQEDEPLAEGSALRPNIVTGARNRKTYAVIAAAAIVGGWAAVNRILSALRKVEAGESRATVANIVTRHFNVAMEEQARILKVKAPAAAKTVVKRIDVESAATSKRSLAKMAEVKPAKKLSPKIKSDIDLAIKNNVSLIKSIPAQHLGKVEDMVSRSLQSGGSAELTTNIQKLLPGTNAQTRRRAEFIATDQTKKIYAALNKSRMLEAGIEKFEWIHSGGGKMPRPFHIGKFPKGLNGGVYSLSDLPVIDKKTGERGLPGQLINCKCVMKPVLF